jgi:hypothetical protein
MSRSRTRRRPAGESQALMRDERAELRRELDVALSNEELVRESFADLAAQLYEPGWLTLSAHFDHEFTPEGLRQIRALCRLMAIKNSLINRGLSLRAAYVFGQGVEISARANGRNRDNPNEQDVQAVVSAFLDDEGNQEAFTGPAAQQRLERCLGTDGEFFPVLFTKPASGAVQIRVVGADDIAEIICNPQDRSEPWFYRRRWVERTLSVESGQTVDKPMEQLHPALGYRPASRPSEMGRVKVAWDAPMLHVKVGDLQGWQRGVPDAYAAIDWARAYKEFLEDWARLVKSLSRFAWRMTAKGSARAQQAKARIAAHPGAGESAVGATAITPPDQVFEAIPKSGATIDSESGKPLASMVAAALDVPLTMLLADPGQTGARAVAETLDQPTELAMGQRRQVWAGAYQRILRYVIAESVRATGGKLKGRIVKDDWGRERAILDGDTDGTCEVSWPDLDEDGPAIVKAIVEASSVGVLPPEQLARLLLTALGVRDIDDLIEAMTDEETGAFIWPTPPAGPANALRSGVDPADALPGGRMEPDDEDPNDDDGSATDGDQQG